MRASATSCVGAIVVTSLLEAEARVAGSGSDTTGGAEVMTGVDAGSSIGTGVAAALAVGVGIGMLCHTNSGSWTPWKLNIEGSPCMAPVLWS